MPVFSTHAKVRNSVPAELRDPQASQDSLRTEPSGKYNTEEVNTLAEAHSGTRAVAFSTGLLIMTLLLAVVGLLMVFSSSAVQHLIDGKDPFWELFKDGAMLAVGLAGMLVASRIPWFWYDKFADIFFAAALIAQALIIVPGLAVTRNGNTNWVNLGFVTFQPSEILKLALILWMSKYLYRSRQHMHEFKPALIPSGLGALLALAMVAAGKDIGTCMIMVLIIGGIYWAAGLKISWILLGLITIVSFITVAFVLPSPQRMERIMLTFSACDVDPQNAGYQLCHSMYSLGSGGIWGLGLGQSREKWSYLPEASSDFILAIIGEELGLAGSTLVILLFLGLGVFFYCSIRLMRNHFQRVATTGIMTWILLQAIINILVVVGWFPVMGLPLPFVSAGTSSLWSCLLAVGIVMSFDNSYRDQKIKVVKAKPIVSLKG